MDFQNIIDKYKYPEDFIPFLKKVYGSLIQFLGKDNESLVYQVFLNTTFVFNQNVYSVLSDHDMLDVNDIVGEKELKRASGVYEAKPIIQFDGSKFYVKDVQRLIVIANFSLDKPYTIATFIHELGHAIKAYHKEFSIEGDILIRRSGLIEERYQLNYVNGKVMQTLISKRNTGIEEGLNTLFEEKVMQQYFDPNYESKAYNGVLFMANILCDRFSLFDSFLNAEIYKDSQALIDFLGEANYDELIYLFERVYKLDLKRYDCLGNLDELKKVSEERNHIAHDEFLLLYNKIKMDRNRGL